jgi:hypothetical protein
MLAAPPRLGAHLTLVHDVACELLAALEQSFPSLQLNRGEVLFGAATHDLGKVLHPEELSGRGHEHEAAGEQLLLQHRVAPQFARFARTHGAWRHPDLPLEDLLVALADKVWRGERREELEAIVTAHIAAELARSEWEVWSELDRIVQSIASRADERLAWQSAADK